MRFDFLCAENLTGKPHPCSNCTVVRLIRQDNHDDRYTDRVTVCKDRHCIGAVRLNTGLYVQDLCVNIKINCSYQTHITLLCLTCHTTIV